MQSVEVTNTTGTHMMYTRRSTALCYFGTINPFPPPPFFWARWAQLPCVMSMVILCWLLESNLQTGYIYSCLHCLTISWWMTHPFPPFSWNHTKEDRDRMTAHGKQGEGIAKTLLCVQNTLEYKSLLVYATTKNNPRIYITFYILVHVNPLINRHLLQNSSICVLAKADDIPVPWVHVSLPCTLNSM